MGCDLQLGPMQPKFKDSDRKKVIKIRSLCLLAMKLEKMIHGIGAL
jgi:hypothetical protein